MHTQDTRVRDRTEQVRNVTRVFVHKAYSNTTYDNDIAVMVLNQSLDFNDHVKPIQLRDPSWELPGRGIFLMTLPTSGTATKDLKY